MRAAPFRGGFFVDNLPLNIPSILPNFALRFVEKGLHRLNIDCTDLNLCEIKANNRCNRFQKSV